MASIGIVGNGFVGGATALIGETIPLTEEDIKMFIYDRDDEKCSHRDISLESLTEGCNFIFVCVPTPMNLDGSCETIEVEKVVIELKDLGYDPERIIIRSTVPVGTCKRLGTMFMPEFLTEKRWEKDFTDQQHWILGTNERNDSIRDELYSIFKRAYDNKVFSRNPIIHFLTTEEAELVKYVRNSFLAVKVSFFNEIYDFCGASEIDFDKVKDMSILDERVGESHTQVPGPDGKRGFGGTCFPKDIASFKHQLLDKGIIKKDSSVISASISRNNDVDRPEQDWKSDKGRAIV
jgi:UDPglucose 6-dehydrogenase